MKAQILQLICTVCVDLSSGLPGGQFHYAFWEISSLRNEASPGWRSTYQQFLAIILAKVGCTTFFNLINCVRDSSLLEIVRNQLLVVVRFMISKLFFR